MRMNTKETRLAVRQARTQAIREKPQGQLTEYRDLLVATYDEPIGGLIRPCLEVWRGTAYKPEINAWYRSEESRQAKIDGLKVSADQAHARKAERKAQPKTLSSAAQAAQLIREELKRAYPTVKFSVKSSNYSGGNSVDVNWDLGPTTRQIDAIIDKYQYGDFDGMTDSYNYRPGKERTAASAKFVFANRDNPLYEKMCQDYAAAMRLDYTGPEMRVPNHDQWLGTMVHQLLSDFDLTAHGYQGIQPTDKLGAGNMSDFYIFVGAQYIDRYATTA